MLIYVIGFILFAIAIKYFLFTHKKYTKPTRIDGKIVIITGGSTGIGKACATDLAKRGGKIYIACRKEPINEQAFDDIKQESGSENVHFLELDLASLNSVRKFSEEFHKMECKLDILINNAGVLVNKKQLTEDGFELHMGVNFLGHFLLTNLLLDLLKASVPSRVVFVTSNIHKHYSLNEKDFMNDCNFSNFREYALSKLALVIFTIELSKRLKDTNVTVNCCHPGMVITNINDNWENSILDYLKTLMVFRSLFKTPLEGAQNHIKLAVDPDLQAVTGKYFEDCQIKEPSNQAKDSETGRWLWEKSFELVRLGQNV